MTIQETIEQGIGEFTKSISYEKRLSFFTDEFESFLRKYSRDLLQSVLDGLPPVLGESTMNLQYKHGNNQAVEYMFNSLTSAIDDLKEGI